MAKGNTRDPARERMWRQAVRDQARSGLTVRAFCRQSKLAESAFYFWRRELQRRREQRRARPGSPSPQQGRRRAGTSRRSVGAAEQIPKPAVAPTFVPVHLAQADATASAPVGMLTPPAEPFTSRIQITLPDGVRIHLAPPVDCQALADVLATLAAEGVEPAAGFEKAAARPFGEDRPC